MEGGIKKLDVFLEGLLDQPNAKFAIETGVKKIWERVVESDEPEATRKNRLKAIVEGIIYYVHDNVK
jgi:hypothetical protein